MILYVINFKRKLNLHKIKMIIKTVTTASLKADEERMKSEQNNSDFRIDEFMLSIDGRKVVDGKYDNHGNLSKKEVVSSLAEKWSKFLNITPPTGRHGEYV